MRFDIGALALLLVVPIFAAAATGPPSELELFVVSDATALKPGEEANLTIFTFINGERASVNGEVGARVVGGIYGLDISLPIRPGSPGIYALSYIMTASHADVYGYVEILVTASHSSLGPSGETRSVESKYVTLTLSGSGAGATSGGWSAAARLTDLSTPLPAPGARASFECRLLNNGAPADPESVLFVMEHRELNGEPMNYTAPHERLAPGVYLVNFTIPNIRHSDYFYLRALVPGAESGLYTGASLSLTFYTVLYRELGTSGGLRRFEVLVSDGSGAAVHGAEVRLAFYLPEQTSTRTELVLGRTDSAGRVSGALPAPDSIDGYYVTGWVNTSRRSQSFWGWISLPGTSPLSPPDDEGFYVFPISYSYHPRPAPLPGESFSATYRVFWSGEPVAEQELKCYVTKKAYDQFHTKVTSASVECTRALTDSSGNLSLNLTMPEGDYGDIDVLFKNPFPPTSSGPYNYEDHDYFRAYSSSGEGGSDIAASFSRASPGGAVLVRASAAASEPLSARLSWDISSDPSGAMWRVWSSPIWYLKGPDESGAFSGRVVLPAHLKPGMNLSFSLNFYNGADSFERSFEVRVEAERAEPRGTDICCLAGLAVVNLGLIVFLVGSYLASRRSREARPEGEELERRVQEILDRAERRQETLPRRVALEASGLCFACGRMVARGNIALICSCGQRFHEHCVVGAQKCPSCGRGWGVKYL